MRRELTGAIFSSSASKGIWLRMTSIKYCGWWWEYLGTRIEERQKYVWERMIREGKGKLDAEARAGWRS